MTDSAPSTSLMSKRVSEDLETSVIAESHGTGSGSWSVAVRSGSESEALEAVEAHLRRAGHDAPDLEAKTMPSGSIIVSPK